MAVYVDDAVCNITEYTRDSFSSNHSISFTMKWRTLYSLLHTLSSTDLSTVFHARNWWNPFENDILLLQSCGMLFNTNISQFSEKLFFLFFWLDFHRMCLFIFMLKMGLLHSIFLWMCCCWNLCVSLLTQTSAHYSSWVHIYACALCKKNKMKTTKIKKLYIKFALYLH